MALVTGSYLYTISKIQVAAAILIQYLAPIFVAIFSMLFWKERPTVFKITALFLAFGGCFLVVGGYNLELLQMNLLGILGGLTSAITFAGYSLLGERAMHRYKPWTVIFYALAFSALTWHVVYPPFTYLTAGYSLAQWGWIFYIAIVGTVLPFGLFFAGINSHPFHPGKHHGDPGAHLCRVPGLHPSRGKTPASPNDRGGPCHHCDRFAPAATGAK